MSTLSDQIETDAVKSKAVANGDVSTTRRDLREQIAADEYLERKTAAAAPFDVLRSHTRVAVPPGASE